MKTQKNHFYSHIIKIDSVHAALHDLDLTVEEREELIIILDSTVHHVVIDVILSELSTEDKKTALSHIAEEKHDDLWNLLKTKIEKVEDKIHTAVSDLVKNLHSDLEEAKKKG